MKRILSNTTSAIVAQIVAIIYGFVLPRLILEQFGSELYGLTQSIKQFLGFISLLDMGVGQVVRSSLYKSLADKDALQISRVMTSGRNYYRKISYILLVYVAILIVCYPYLVDGSFDWLFSATMIIVIAISVFAQYFFGIINEQLLHADQKSYLIYVIQVAGNLINLIVCVLLIRMGATIHIIQLATSVVYLMKPLLYAAYIRKKYSIDHKIKLTQEPIKQKWYGIAQHISAVILTSTDTIVLTIFSTLQNVSVYSVYYMIISSIQKLYYSATVGIQSAAGAVWAKQDKEKIKQMFFTTECSLHAITIILFSCLGILIVPFVRVFTNGLTDANYVQPLFACLLVLAFGIFCLRTPYNIWILAAGHFKQTQPCHIVAAVLNLLISVLAVCRWGLVGIALGTLVAMCYQTGWMAIYTMRNLVECSAEHLIKRLVIDVLMIAVICVATFWIKMTETSYLAWFFMAIKVGILSVAITACLTALCYPAERKILFSQLKGKVLRGR